MIRVKLLSEREYSKLRQDGRCASYHEILFSKLLQEKGDFVDQESLLLLRHLHGEVMVREKLYRPMAADGKPCLPAISREAMYGLVVLENSRRGIYTLLETDFRSFEIGTHGKRHDHPQVWTAFADMDMDILLAYRIRDFGLGAYIPINEEFVLEGYPIQGEPTDVHVVHEYMREPELRDGKWYIHNEFYDQKYRWTENTDELLEILQQDTWGRTPLARGVFSLKAFEDMCWPKSDYSFYFLSRMPEEAEEVSWQIVNHMDYLPEDGESRRLLYLIIEESADGKACLRDEISVKYPTYDEMFAQAMEEAKEGCELLILPVDVNEVMCESADIWKAVCAFRVAGNVIETFGPTEGLREFEAALRRAVKNG